MDRKQKASAGETKLDSKYEATFQLIRFSRHLGPANLKAICDFVGEFEGVIITNWSEPKDSEELLGWEPPRHVARRNGRGHR